MESSTGYDTSRGGRSGVKNKAAAKSQITAEQLIREAYEQQEPEFKKSKEIINDKYEFQLYKKRKREEFEMNLRKTPDNISRVTKYAKWEADMKEFDRARSIFNRGLQSQWRKYTLWTVYADTELKHGFINRARNVYERAIKILPTIDQLWYKYAYLEEKLKNFQGARKIYERWISGEIKPGMKGFMTFVNFELRVAQDKAEGLRRARSVYEKFLVAHPKLESWLQYARWEMHKGNFQESREIYERCLNELQEVAAASPEFFIAWTKLEIRTKEFKRARQIFEMALNHIPEEESKELLDAYLEFEKQHGGSGEIETRLIDKRRLEFNKQIKQNPHDYHTWFDWLKLELQNGNPLAIRETFEKAIACRPLIEEKLYWARYIYFWIKYAIYTEIHEKDPDRTEQIYQGVLNLVPHDVFSFPLLWLLAAKFQIRQVNVDTAVNLLTKGLVYCPNDSALAALAERLKN